MKPYQITYNRSRFPECKKREDGTFGCRGCGGDIPKGRLTWCSKKCCDTFHPAFVISNVRKRDNEICALCNRDMKVQKRDWMKLKPDYRQSGWAVHQQWLRECPNVNYDHIVPFSEGGMTVLENIRTLCEPCHKKRTKDWHRDRRDLKEAWEMTIKTLSNIRFIGGPPTNVEIIPSEEG